MITIKGRYSVEEVWRNETSLEFEVDIPVDSFSEIEEENMPIRESDKIIAEAILEKYGDVAKTIYVDREV